MAGYGNKSPECIGRVPVGLSPGSEVDMLKKNPAPMALELQDQFEATKSLLQAIAKLESRLNPVLSQPSPSPANETATDASRPPMLQAVHENTRAVALGLSQLHDIMERLVI